MAAKEREYSELEEIWKAEKSALLGTQHIKSELENARIAMDQARRENDFEKMSELQYGVIPNLEKQLQAVENGEKMQMLSSSVLKSPKRKLRKCFQKQRAFLLQNDGRREGKTPSYGRSITRSGYRAK